jgi:hypothetical protein
MSMTVFEAINKFLSDMETRIVIEKNDVDNYDVLCNKFDKRVELRSREIGKNIIDVFVSAMEGTGVSDNITVTESERKILNKIAGIIDDYSPFLGFHMIHITRLHDESKIDNYYLVGFSASGCWYGKTDDSANKMDIEAIITESIHKASLDLKLLDKNNTLAIIADYIKYENSRNPDNDAEVIIRKKDGEFSVFIRTNSISQDKYINLNPSVEKKDRYIQYAVKDAIEENNNLTNWTDGKYYLSKVVSPNDYSFDKIADVLNKLKNENIIFRVYANINTNDRFVLRNSGYFKAEFRDASSGELLVESCNNNLKKAVFDVSKKMIKLKQLPLKISYN